MLGCLYSAVPFHQYWFRFYGNLTQIFLLLLLLSGFCASHSEAMWLMSSIGPCFAFFLTEGLWCNMQGLVWFCFAQRCVFKSLLIGHVRFLTWTIIGGPCWNTESHPSSFLSLQLWTHMRPLSCRWAVGGGSQVAVAHPDSSWRQRHCPHAPHYAQQQSGRESERPRDRRSLLQGGPRKALFRPSRDRTWQLWRCIFCKYLSSWGGPFLENNWVNLAVFLFGWCSGLACFASNESNEVLNKRHFIRSSWVGVFIRNSLEIL